MRRKNEEWPEENRAQKTYTRYRDCIQSFVSEYGRMDVGDLNPVHVTKWLATHKGWNSTTKRNAITALQRAFKWAVKNRGLPRNPIRGMEKPEAKRRTTTVTADEFDALLKRVQDVPFRDLLIVSYDSGSYVRRKITHAAEPGDRVPAYLVIPKQIEGRAPAMLCLHPTSPLGNAQIRGLDGRPSGFYAHELAERGFVCLPPDYPSFGDYEYDFRVAGSPYASGSMKGMWNHIRAVDLLEAMPVVHPDRIGCIGHSLGGHNALFVAADHLTTKYPDAEHDFPDKIREKVYRWLERLCVTAPRLPLPVPTTGRSPRTGGQLDSKNGNRSPTRE